MVNQGRRVSVASLPWRGQDTEAADASAPCRANASAWNMLLEWVKTPLRRFNFFADIFDFKRVVFVLLCKHLKPKVLFSNI